MKKTNNKNLHWDSKIIFASKEDWNKSFISLSNRIEKIKRRWNEKGEVNSPSEILQKFEDLEELFRKNRVLQEYLRFFDLDTTNQYFIQIEEKLETQTKKVNDLKIILLNEVLSSSDQKLNDLLELSNLFRQGKWKRTILLLKRNKKHFLSEKEEKIINELSGIKEYFYKLFQNINYADNQKVFTITNGHKEEITEEKLQKILQKSDAIKDQKKRKLYAKKFSQRNLKLKNTFNSLYYGLVKGITMEAKLRGYNSVIETILKEDPIPNEVFKNLFKFSEKFSFLVTDYYLLKKKHLKLKNFYPSDRQLSFLSQEKVQQIWNPNIQQTIGIIKKITTKSSHYSKSLEKILQTNSIDTEPRLTKIKGGYCSSSYDTPPLILINWTENISSAITLAHELGHAVHNKLSKKKQYWPNFDSSILISEVMSIGTEHLFIQKLLVFNLETKFQINLLQNSLEEFIGSTFIQIKYFEFEKKVFDSYWKEKIYSPNQLAEIFQDKMKSIFGTSLSKKEKSLSFSWSKIPHFFLSPFYVFNYALASISVIFLWKKIAKEDSWIYLEQLSKLASFGSSKDSLELLKTIGIDLTNWELYEIAGNYLKSEITKIKKILKEEN